MTSRELNRWYRAQLRELAARYGISLVSRCRSRDFVAGPTFGGFSMTRPVVQWCSSMCGSIHDRAAFNLHELAHRVCQPPTIDTDLVAEHWLIFALEAAWMRVIRAVLPPRWRSDFTAAFNLYERSSLFTPFIPDTRHDFYGERLGECSGLSQWRRSSDAVRLGIVTHDGKPTWQWPTWSTDQLSLYCNWIRRHRRSFRLTASWLPANMSNWTHYLHPQLREGCHETA